MRRFILLIASFLFTVSSMANVPFSVKYSQDSDSERQLLFSLGNYSIENTTINGQTYATINFNHSITTMDKGWAQLPFISSSLVISNDKNVSIDVANSHYVDIQLDYPLLPSRGVIYRNQDPSSIAYEIDPASIVDAWYPKALASADNPYILRDIRGTNVKVYPFRYNAAQNTLRVYTEVAVNVVDNNAQAINPKKKNSNPVLREMDAMYTSMFINYADQSREDLPIGNYGDIHIITTERDVNVLQPFIEWKKEKGFNVSMEVVATGTNVKNNVQAAYDANPNILYVQLSGDWNDIKCDLGGGANAPMDPMLGCVVGSDWYPEIAIGRFSGSSPAQITIQVDKAINYEKNPDVGADWYGKSLGVASDEGSGTGDDGEMDKTHVQIIYDHKLDPYTYDFHHEVYAPGASASSVTTAVNEGVSVANYCGHGSNTSWVTTGFSNVNIASLSNENRLPFIFSVACVNGAFHSGECFGEAWLKKEGGGAVMALMATINQPWTPPQRGQDYFNDILTGGYNYSSNPGNGSSTQEGRIFLGSVVVNGLNLMYAESSGTSDLETIQTWTTFGDCALQPRTMAPAELSLSNEVIISGVDFNTTVTSNGNPVAGAMVGLSQAIGDLYYGGITDDNGEITIAHDLIPGDAKLVVTSMNTQTIYQDIVVISPAGPYLVIDDIDMNTADGMVFYDSEANMDVLIKNLGADPASDVVITLVSGTDSFCTLLSASSVNIGTVGADEVITIEDAFTFDIADNAPDQYSVELSFEITGTAKETWLGNASFIIKAPFPAFGSYVIDDSNANNNAKLDPGETVDIIIQTHNNGHAATSAATVMASTNSAYLSINTTSIALDPIPIGGMQEVTINITVASNTPAASLVDLILDYSAGNYTANKSIQEMVGLIIEDFETGDFSQFDWQFNGYPWFIVGGDQPYEGDYAARSKSITHNQSSILEIDYTAATDDEISFHYKVSSESGYDYLRFYIDDVEQDKWSGTVAWTEASYNITAGEHHFKWAYTKDGSVSYSNDCAWLDNILLPISNQVQAHVFINPENQQVSSQDVFYTTIAINDAQNLGGFECELSFNPDHIQANSISLDEFLGSTGRTLYPLNENINNISGSIAYAITSVGDTPPGPNGSGNLMTIEWHVADGLSADVITDINFVDMQLTQVTGDPLSTTLNNGQVDISACYPQDFDCDCDVDIVDITSAAYAYGSVLGDSNYQARYDLDNDGDVDIVDITTITYNYGWSCGSGKYTPLIDVDNTKVIVNIKDKYNDQEEMGYFNVHVNQVQEFGAYEITLNYQAQDIEILEIIPGEFLQNTPRKTLELVSEFSNEEGYIKYAITSLGNEDPGAMGSGELLKIQYRKKTGKSNIQLNHIQLARIDGIPISFSLDQLQANQDLSLTSIKAYPIPMLEVLNIDYHLKSEGILDFEIHDLEGRLIRNWLETHQTPGSFTSQIHKENLARGTYVLTIKKDKQIWKKLKIMVQ